MITIFYFLLQMTITNFACCHTNWSTAKKHPRPTTQDPPPPRPATTAKETSTPSKVFSYFESFLKISFIDQYLFYRSSQDPPPPRPATSVTDYSTLHATIHDPRSTIHATVVKKKESRFGQTQWFLLFFLVQYRIHMMVVVGDRWFHVDGGCDPRKRKK